MASSGCYGHMSENICADLLTLSPTVAYGNLITHLFPSFAYKTSLTWYLHMSLVFTHPLFRFFRKAFCGIDRISRSK